MYLYSCVPRAFEEFSTIVLDSCCEVNLEFGCRRAVFECMDYRSSSKYIIFCLFGWWIWNKIILIASHSWRVGDPNNDVLFKGRTVASSSFFLTVITKSFCKNIVSALWLIHVCIGFIYRIQMNLTEIQYELYTGQVGTVGCIYISDYVP